MIHVLRIDELTFTVRWSNRRRTIAIAVGSGGELRAAAPVGCPPVVLEAAVRDRLDWVRKKLAEQELRAAQQTRAYEAGELFPYLGRRYPLRPVEAPELPVRLRGGRFELDRALVHDGRAQMAAWYSARARRWIPARLDRFLVADQPAPSALQVRDMGRRWGSCNGNGRISVNWQTILLPPPIIDYILVHELMHLRELNHSKAFWQHVEAAMPDCAERRKWLRLHGHRHVLL